MANFTTTDDIARQALWLAGEPTDGTSDYAAQVVSWMQLVYDTLVNGGTLGTRDIAVSAGLYERFVSIPIIDWLWLRKYPPYAFITTPAIVNVGVVSFTNGLADIVFSEAPTVSVAGWRLKIGNFGNSPATVPRIVDHIAGEFEATLDTAWPLETQDAGEFVLFQVEYTLPNDFVRFCESPAIHISAGGGPSRRIAVGSSEQVGDSYPVQEIGQGAPNAASRLTATVLQLNRWDTQSYRVEFSYIFLPPALALGVSQQPAVPLRFRQVLTIGAAMLIAQDKVDGRAGSLSSEFREIVAHMGHEYRHEHIRDSRMMGRHLFRPYGWRRWNAGGFMITSGSGSSSGASDDDGGQSGGAGGGGAGGGGAG